MKLGLTSWWSKILQPPLSSIQLKLQSLHPVFAETRSIQQKLIPKTNSKNKIQQKYSNPYEIKHKWIWLNRSKNPNPNSTTRETKSTENRKHFSHRIIGLGWVPTPNKIINDNQGQPLKPPWISSETSI